MKYVTNRIDETPPGWWIGTDFVEIHEQDVGKVLGIIRDEDGNPAYGLVSKSGGGGGAVDSVNGQTGAVVLDADDVGASPAPTEVTVATTGAVTQVCEDNHIYYFRGELTSLTLTEATGAREYVIVFNAGNTAPTVTFPTGVEFPSSFTVEANKRYEVSVRDQFAVAQSWGESR